MPTTRPATARQPHALFVWLKYFNGLPEAGECGWRTIVEPFSANGVGTWDAYFYDEVLAAGQDKDACLLRMCEKRHYDVLFLYWMPDVTFMHLNIRPETLFTIRTRLHIPIVMIWYDTWDPKFAAQAIGLAPLCDLAVVTDSLAHVAQAPRREKYLNLCYSPNVQQFRNPGLERTIPLSHNGEVNSRKDRKEVLAALDEAGLPLTRHGGFFSEPLSTAAYAEVFQRSKVTINFSATPSGKRTFKARVMEAALCGAMLLEQDNAETAARFTPYRDYVPFEDTQDLVDKARYYLEHDAEREAIARSGMLRAQELAKPESFWGRIIQELERPGLFDPQEARAGLRRFVDEIAPRYGILPAKHNLHWLVGKRVAIWGTGAGYRDNFAAWLQEEGGSFSFQGFVDSDQAKWGSLLDGHPVFGPEEILARGVEAIIFATYAVRGIYNEYNAQLPTMQFFH